MKVIDHRTLPLALSSISDWIQHIDAMCIEYLNVSKLRNLIYQMMAQWGSENIPAYCNHRLNQVRFNLIGSKIFHWTKTELLQKVKDLENVA